jgi:hypothetical protein
VSLTLQLPNCSAYCAASVRPRCFCTPVARFIYETFLSLVAASALPYAALPVSSIPYGSLSRDSSPCRAEQSVRTRYPGNFF